MTFNYQYNPEPDQTQLSLVPNLEHILVTPVMPGTPCLDAALL